MNYIGGVISTKDLEQFRRLVVRAGKCKIFVHSVDLELADEDRIIGDDYDV